MLFRSEGRQLPCADACKGYVCCTVAAHSPMHVLQARDLDGPHCSGCSRNTAQKQWDETLVMALSGMARLLKAFFPYLHTMANFDLGQCFQHPFLLHAARTLCLPPECVHAESSLLGFPALSRVPATQCERVCNCACVLSCLDCAPAGWSGLLQFVEESVLTGNREVALAALALLQTVPLTHASKARTGRGP